ncbi:MAG TPA: hypothetical protein VFU31_21210 [Candidatus Binatia bacterium]|nr:hypothetical protein [Candidatus Binatia bacterium]
MKWQSLTIVCNEAPWIEVQVRSLLDQFDRVVVVDGAAAGDTGGAGDGHNLTGGLHHSTDGTVEILQRLEREVPKLKVVYAPAGGWLNKTAMCNAGLFHMEPGWIVQRDVDEFFAPTAFQLLKWLVDDSDYTDVEFFAYHFWGDRRHYMRLSREIWGNVIPWRRVFRWQGEPWASHEPPRFKRKTAEKLLTMEETRALGIILWHYSYCDLGQLRKKEIFYGIQGQLVPTVEQWRKDPKSIPKNADLEEFNGLHPVKLPVVD